MCGPSTSSQLYKEMIRHPELWTKSIYEPLEAYNSMDINRIIDEAESMYEIKLLGGEPTVQPETKAIMKRTQSPKLVCLSKLGAKTVARMMKR